MRSKGKLKKIVSLTAIVCILLATSVFIVNRFVLTHPDEDELINISSLSKEFMDTYLEKVYEIEDEDKEHILIVTSKEAIEDTHGAKDIIPAPNHQYILQYDSEDSKQEALKELKENSDIISVDENVIRSFEDTASTSTYNSWGIEKIGLDYAIGSVDVDQASEIVVAVVDSGLDVTLFDIAYPGKLKETYNALNPDAAMVDEVGHGTHIAGTIAEATPSNVKVMAVKVGESRNFYTTDVIAGINYITYYDKADVINMSFGGYVYNSAEYQAVAAANSKNIICVAAAGNDNKSDEHYPSGFDNTISVSSYDSSFHKSDFSNYGSSITFSAPGTSIFSINGTKSGTSMATPHVASAVAILKSFNPDLSLNDVITLLKKHVIDLGDTGWDQYYGYGAITFLDANFCDGTDCDEFGVFKEEDVSTMPVLKLEPVSTITPRVDYGNETNLMNARFNLYYTDTEYYEKTLAELSDEVEIIGYDPYSYTTQFVKIKYKDLQATLRVNNRNVTDLVGWNYSVLADNTIRLTELICSSDSECPKVIYIPEELDGYQVSTLGASLFANNQTLTSVKFSSGIMTVEEDAFYECHTLNRVTLSDNLVEIGNRAFFDTQSLTAIHFPEGLKIIDSNAFAFSGLTSVVLPNSVETIGAAAFSENKNLAFVDLPDNLQIISSSLFSGDGKLASIELPNTLESIGSYAFEATGLTSITIPSSVETISRKAFISCSKLTSVTLFEGLRSIEQYAFVGTKLVSVNIPSSVETIELNPFFNIDTLKTLTVDNKNAFYESRNSSMIIEKNPKKLVASISSDIPEDIKMIGGRAINSSSEIITLPEGVTNIENYAFGGCEYDTLKTIVLPKTLTTIDQSAFKVSTTLTSREQLPKDLVLWVYDGTIALDYALENNILYFIREPKRIEVQLNKSTYYAFETIKPEDVESVKATFAGSSDLVKTIEEYSISYTGQNENLRYGDSLFQLSFVSDIGDLISYDVGVTVLKVAPDYEIPKNLRGSVGQTLSDIALPSGFTWMDENEAITELGTFTYKARYTPNDTTNFEIVENIEIPIVSGIYQVIINHTKDYEGVYDGKEHSFDLDVEVSNYEVQYSMDGVNYNLAELPKFKEVGEYTVYYKIQADGYDDLLGSNKINIYGIQSLDATLDLKGSVLVAQDYSNSFKNIAKKINVFSSQYSIQHYDKNNNLVSNDLTKTGDRMIILINNEKAYEYVISVLGDVSGDGKLNYLDYVAVYNHIMKIKHPESNKKRLQNEYLLSADTSGDGKINYLDYVKIYNKIKELKGGTKK